MENRLHELQRESGEASGYDCSLPGKRDRLQPGLDVGGGMERRTEIQGTSRM